MLWLQCAHWAAHRLRRSLVAWCSPVTEEEGCVLTLQHACFSGSAPWLLLRCHWFAMRTYDVSLSCSMHEKGGRHMCEDSDCDCWTATVAGTVLPKPIERALKSAL